MILLPAIDMLEGKAVRLARGEFDQRTEYDSDPLAAALRWERVGARALHTYDCGAIAVRITAAGIEISPFLATQPKDRR